MLLEEEVREVEVGVGHVRRDADRFLVRLDREMPVLEMTMHQTEVVVAFAAMRIEIDAAAERGDGVVVSAQAVVDRPQVDVRPGPVRLVTRRLP